MSCATIKRLFRDYTNYFKIERWKSCAKESIQSTIRQQWPATAGTHLWQVLQTRVSTWKSAPSAIRSTQASRKRHRLAAVLISSTKSMVLNKNEETQAEVDISACYIIPEGDDSRLYRRWVTNPYQWRGSISLWYTLREDAQGFGKEWCQQSWPESRAKTRGRVLKK